MIGLALQKISNISNLTLDLWSNMIGVQGSSDLISPLESSIKFSTLTLNLNNNQIDKDCAQCLGSSLVKLINISTLKLSLYSNQITDHGVFNLGSFLSTSQNLINLQLDLDAYKIDDEGGSNKFRLCFIKMQQNAHRPTHNLYLDSFKLIVRQIFNKIKMNLQKVNFSSLEEFLNSPLSFHDNLCINLNQNKIDALGATSLGRALKNCNKISKLNINLNNSQLDGQGLSGFCNSLSQSTKLSYLVLKLCEIQVSNEEFADLGYALSKISNIVTLILYLQEIKQMLKGFLVQLLLQQIVLLYKLQNLIFGVIKFIMREYSSQVLLYQDFLNQYIQN